MFSVVTKYHKGRHPLFLYNSEIFYAFTQDILRSQLAKQEGNVVFGGRLGQYRYYDMHQVIHAALLAVEYELG
ncbi:UDP-galactopyranose mutase [Lactiplantibacillus plantarum]|nr:UDP-galactopyranose mutase [Lactiplantibacillus plantarum]